jgi:two-component system, cell cycle response regulator DivK
MALPFGPISPLAFSNPTAKVRPLAIDNHVALGKIGGTKMNFRSLTQIFSRTRSAPLTYEKCPSIGKKKILIVDDNSDLRKLLALVLKNSDYDTVEAATGLEALNQARATRPDLILMDLFMPDVTGDEAIVWLKADPMTRHIPVIVTTAFSYGPHVDRAIAFGAAEVLYKPFHLKSLQAMLQRHLSVNHQAAASLPITRASPKTQRILRQSTL